MLQYPIQLPPLDLRPQKKSGKHAAAPPKPAPPPPPPPSAPPQDDVPEDPLLPGDVVGEGCHLLGEPISRVPVGQYLQGPLSPSTPSLSHSASTSSSSSDGSDSAGSAYEDAPPAKSFQVIRKLGTGSYAVVYLVAEVLDDDERADSSDEEFDGMLGSFDETQAKHVARAPRLGRHYAIKCLSKANLDEEQLQAQAIEVSHLPPFSRVLRSLSHHR
ncbi:hypothetical protein BD626DRAFT_16828 [Schizophyllum amplum]|uniref:Protein kinase domain-containing protein n=1 Tax=Schizophyllum amplum TaxID=97359 RepID=A0A550CY26_9AGAR|nr:hypothetical protein BD626DRAFT_16828 [Auriculariopsis ampla]